MPQQTHDVVDGFVNYNPTDMNNWLLTIPIGNIHTRASTEFSLSNDKDMKTSVFNIDPFNNKVETTLLLKANGSVAWNGDLKNPLKWTWMGSIIVLTDTGKNEVFRHIIKCADFVAQQLPTNIFLV